MEQSKLIIFCDGGVGNRINSLLSGLAIAKYFKLEYTIHWPVNNWCEAEFNDIFQTLQPISLISIKDLKGKMNDSIMLLHDNIASTVLDVNFASAYDYESMQDFDFKVLTKNKQIFFYPALMPDWIPMDLISFALKGLEFTDQIKNESVRFMVDILKMPFYGIHLRRTDLTVGLTDLEVHQLVTSHKDEIFYVCSDDPIAEKLAIAHENVFCRQKIHHVEKKVQGSWNEICEDDDGRLYGSNIKRGMKSVIEAAVDMLILAQSQIIGFSGSTFQRIAKLIGEVNPALPWDKPLPLSFIINSEVKRQIHSKLFPFSALIEICNKVSAKGNLDQAIELLQYATSYYSESENFLIFHNLSIFYLNKGQSQIARVYLNHLVDRKQSNIMILIHLAYAEYMCGNKNHTAMILNDLKEQDFSATPDSVLQIYNLLIEKNG